LRFEQVKILKKADRKSYVPYSKHHAINAFKTFGPHSVLSIKNQIFARLRKHLQIKNIIRTFAAE